ncbi:MAG: TolB family protein, partial [Marinilabiliaceae bacterium]
FMYKKTMFFCFLAGLISSVSAQTYDDAPADFFFGDDVTSKPAMMSDGFISTGMDERGGSMNPENDEFYYTLRHGSDISVILVSRFRDGFWEFPEVASFSGKYRDASPFVSPDGRYLYFSSRRPVSDDDSFKNWNLWRCRRSSDGTWEEPELLSFCSEERNELSVSVDRDGVVYFHADYEGETVSLSREAFDIYYAEPLPDGEWSEIEKLDSSISTEHRESYPAISPDGRRLVFSSNRSQGHGGTDLYLSLKKGEKWGRPVNLGRAVNSGSHECCASFTADGRYLLFSSSRKKGEPDKMEYSTIKKWILGPGNGSGDIWYIDAGELELFPETQP